MVHNIIQNSLSRLLCCDLGQLESSRVTLRLASYPPGDQCENHTGAHQAHGRGKRHSVVRRIFASEDLWSNGTADLTVAVDEADGEGGACGSGGGLDAPWPVVVHSS